MTTQSLLLLAAFLLVLLTLSYPMGILLARVGGGGAVPGFGWLQTLENLLYRAAGTASTGDALSGCGAQRSTERCSARRVHRQRTRSTGQP